MNAQTIAKNIVLSLSAIRLIPHIIILNYHRSREIIVLDIARWSREIYNKKAGTGLGMAWTFVQIMTFYPEYRNLFYYRIGWPGKVLYLLCRPMPLLAINRVDEGIGPGFFIMHGRASGVAAKKIGSNCRIFQHVSIGYLNESEKPTLGDNVTIFAGAKVFGNIRIGDNCIVGANAVVTKNVPDNCTVVGVPAYIVRKNGVKVKEPL